jgi:small subunit ribosomal protein S1
MTFASDESTPAGEPNTPAQGTGTQPDPASAPENAAPVDPSAPLSPASEESPPGQDAPSPPRLRIGSQRPGSEPVKAKAQIESKAAPPPERKKFPPPNKRNALSPELELEYQEALGGMSLDDIVEGKEGQAPPAAELLPETRVRGKVDKVQRGDVFVDLGGRNQGVLPLAHFAEPPEPGAILEFIVSRLDPEDGLFSLVLPGGAVSVEDWSELAEGMTIEVQVTGHNKGGLECQVKNIRGFIPVSQISLYRVEDLAPFVGQKLVCVVTEVKPEKRNLVLSRRAVLEREKAEAKTRLIAELAPGQVREGVVRSIREFGAFVDLGGVDGLLHVSQLSWARVKHPSEVLKEGEKATVKVQKIDPETGKISLAMKELTASPWTNVASKYPVKSRVTGTVSKIMEFGAFVQLEPGVEGLVHISELAHQRVFRVKDIVSEGQEIEVQVTSVDEEKQRIGLSVKAIAPRPEPVKKEVAEPEEPAAPLTPRKPRTTPLKGGIGRGSGGDQFGLKW